MDESYAKVFRSMYTGSMYGAGFGVFAVWGWILAHADENGMVEINPDLIGNELAKGGEPVVQQVREAVTYLMSPDPNSRSPEEQGRRIVHVEAFTYRVVNRPKYRDKGADRTEYWREYKRAKRTGSKVSTVDNVDKCGLSSNSTQAEAEAEVYITPLPPKGGTTKRIRRSIQDSVMSGPCRRCKGASGKPVSEIHEDDTGVVYGLCPDCIKTANPETASAPV